MNTLQQMRQQFKALENAAPSPEARMLARHTLKLTRMASQFTYNTWLCAQLRHTLHVVDCFRSSAERCVLGNAGGSHLG